MKSHRDTYKSKSTKWTDRPTGVTNIVRTDGPSHKVDDWKSKMDEFNSSPHSEWITNSVKELSTKWTDHLNGVIIYFLHKVDESSKR